MNADFFKRPIAHRRIIGLGLIALDVLERDGRVRSAERAGGTCANVLAILSYLGWKSYPIGRLNGDSAAKSIRRDLAAFSVKLDFASLGPHAKTAIVRHLVTTTGTHRYSFRCPACARWLPTYQPVTVRAVRDLLMRVTLRPHVVFIDRGSASALVLAETARELGALVVFEPSGRCSPRITGRILDAAHILKYSRENSAALGLPPRRNVPVEIQTLGADGLRYRLRSGVQGSAGWSVLLAHPVPYVRDGAGSGDWCTAGFLHALVGHRGMSEMAGAIADSQIVRSSLEFGQRIAAWNCLFEGARGSMYTVPRRELKRNVRQALSRALTSSSFEDVSDSVHCELTDGKTAFLSLCIRCGAADDPALRRTDTTDHEGRLRHMSSL